MKSLLFLLPLFGLALADKCPQCPQVKCVGEPAEVMCKCHNDAEQACVDVCPTYIPTFLPCPIRPPPITTASPSPTPTSCVCDEIMCPMVWPESCHCQAGAKIRCYETCGGPKPPKNTCPPISTTTVPTPEVTSIHKVCGGGRGQQQKVCDKGEVCIAAPGTCGPACDQYGVCVKDKLCGGFAGLPCPKGQQCIDDPRDDCVAKKGGADCAGLCY